MRVPRTSVPPQQMAATWGEAPTTSKPLVFENFGGVSIHPCRALVAVILFWPHSLFVLWLTWELFWTSEAGRFTGDLTFFRSIQPLCKLMGYLVIGRIFCGSHIVCRKHYECVAGQVVTMQNHLASIARIYQKIGTGFAPACQVTFRKHPLHLESCVRLLYSSTCFSA